MQSNQNGNRIDTTLGELIATISEIAFETSSDAKEAYELARMVLVEILKDASLTRKVPIRNSTKYLH
jgi:hypothetical protein